MPIFLTFTNLGAATKALIRINQNMGMPITGVDPNTKRQKPECQRTLIWDNIPKAHGQNLWFFEKPKQEFMNGVTDFIEQPFDPNWRGPIKENA